MVKSMTGYGRAAETLNLRAITVEIRSVNHRYFDFTLKTGRSYSFLDDAVKAAASGSIARGKVDIFIAIDASESEDVAIKLNEPLLRGYLDTFTKLNTEYDISNNISISDILRIPDILTVEKKEVDADELSQDVLKVLRAALDSHSDMRAKEGARLADDMLVRIDRIGSLTDEIELRSPKCVDEYREKLESRMKEVLESAMIEPQRILTEAAIFAEKIAVTEEIVRLRSHLAQFKDMLKNGGAIGRKLDFLVQELNREVNTIGSKANDLLVTSIVVEMKAEIEKIREQVQNIE